MATARAVAVHVAPLIHAAADAAGRDAPRIVAGLPVAVHDRRRRGARSSSQAVRLLRRAAQLPPDPRPRRRRGPRRRLDRRRRGCRHRADRGDVRRRRDRHVGGDLPGGRRPRGFAAPNADVAPGPRSFVSPSVIDGACRYAPGDGRSLLRAGSRARSPSGGARDIAVGEPGEWRDPVHARRSPRRCVPDGRRLVVGVSRRREGPVHEVVLRPLRVDAYAVNNDRFAEFVGATGTDRRRALRVVIRLRRFPPRRLSRHQRGADAPWWRQVYGADWRHPEGPQSDVDGAGRPPGGARVVERRASPTAPGPEPAFRPKRSGSTRRVAEGKGTRSRGATTSSPTASIA